MLMLSLPNEHTPSTPRGSLQHAVQDVKHLLPARAALQHAVVNKLRERQLSPGPAN